MHRYTVVTLVLVLLLAALPAVAQNAESGLMVLTNFETTIGGTAHSYGIFEAAGIGVWGTLLAPERGESMGLGLDVGSKKALGRAGVGIVEDTWGIYLRASVGW